MPPKQEKLAVKRDPRVIAMCDVYNADGSVHRTVTLFRERCADDSFSYELYEGLAKFRMGTVEPGYALACFGVAVNKALEERVGNE